MRSLLLAIVAGLAVLAVRINADDAPLDDADLEIDFDADAIARMLGDLFDDEDYARDSKEVAPKEVMVFDQEGQALYNNLFDTIFSRINSLSRSYLNPFTFRMKGNESDRIRKDSKKSAKKGKKESQDNKKKKKKNGRHPKDLDLGEEEDNEDQTPVEAEDDEGVVEDHSISKREVEFDLVEIEEDEDDDDEKSGLEEDEEEESLVRMTRDVRMEDEVSPAEAASRRGKPAKGKKGSTKKGSKKKKNGGKKRKGSKKKSNKNVKKNRPKNKEKKGKSNKGKKGNKKSGKKGKKEGKDKNKKKRKNGRHPKDLDLGEEEEDSEDQTPVEAEEEDEEVAEDHNISKREIEFDLVEIEEDEDDDDDEESDLEEDDEEESEVRIARSADMEDDASSPAEETSRRGKPAKGKKDSTKKGGKKNGGKKRKGGKKKNNKKSSNKNSNKKGRKNKNKSKRDAKGSAIHTSKASVTGIDTIKRQGDVKISNKQGGKEMRAQFTLGPVDLKVSRKYGKGKDSVTKEARAVAPELTGKLAIQVLSDSTTNLLSFRINRPAIVQVDGTIRKTNKLGKSNNNFMERSIGRFSPVLSRKLSIATTNILALVNQKLAKKSIK